MDGLFETQVLSVAGYDEGARQALRVNLELVLHRPRRHMQDLCEVFKRQRLYRCHVAVSVGNGAARIGDSWNKDQVVKTVLSLLRNVLIEWQCRFHATMSHWCDTGIFHWAQISSAMSPLPAPLSEDDSTPYGRPSEYGKCFDETLSHRRVCSDTVGGATPLRQQGYHGRIYYDGRIERITWTQ